MTTFSGNAPNAVDQTIKSTDPEEKVIEFQQLEQQARKIEINRKENTKVTKALATNRAFRAPIEPEAGQKRLIATRNLPGEARFEGRVMGSPG